MRSTVVKFGVMIFLFFFMVAGVSLMSHAEDATGTTQGKKEALPGTQKVEVALTIGAISGNKVSIDLLNGAPVRGLQFTVKGAKMTELRTTSRSAGFLAKFNEENGIVIMASTTEEAITIGKGAIAEIICEKTPSPEISLSGITIVGEGREVLMTSK